MMDYRDGVVNSFTAELLHDCLISAPFNATVAPRFLSYYKDNLQFQITLAYPKNPPSTYKQPSVDLLGGLDSIQRAVDTGVYKNEYDFEAAVQKLVYATRDAHISLYAGALSVFTFGAPVSIVSVSTDGIAYPKVFILALLPQDRGIDFYITYAGFNIRDAVRRNNPTPLQFQYLPTDYHIFYTVPTVYNFENLWNYVIDAMWRNPSLCIAGSAAPFAPSTASNSSAALPAKLSERSINEKSFPLQDRALIQTFENDVTFTPSASQCTVCPNARENCTEIAYCDRGQRTTMSVVVFAPARETAAELPSAPAHHANAAFVRRPKM
ncbi:MAG: hypothetical protein Q9199_007833 [Rusavskia elegans]